MIPLEIPLIGNFHWESIFSAGWFLSAIYIQVYDLV